MRRFNGDTIKIAEAAAKRRLADEYDAAQERGEVAKIGDNLPSVPDGNAKPTAADLGLSRKDIHEARLVRDAERECALDGPLHDAWLLLRQVPSAVSLTSTTRRRERGEVATRQNNPGSQGQ